jgi:two-component system cell cycle sensor histidine kinase/response regulator CckA
MPAHKMHCGTLQAKLDLAEQVLDYSNRNLQLTMEILVGTAKDIEPFLHEQNENAAAISILIEKIREQVESEKERELLDAASAQLARARGYTSLQPLTDGQGRFDAATATANLILPLLLDNNAWKAFIHFLRVQAEPSTPADHSHRELTARTRQLVRAHQEMKSAVAERKRIAERLSQLASIIELSSDAIVIFTLDGTIVSWNAGAESVYGYSASEVLGSPRSVLLPRDRPDDLPAIVGTLKRGERIQRYETVHMRKGGQRIDVSMTMSPVKDASDEILGAAAIARDISDRKLLEKQLRQAQRMEAIGQLSGGIAHDFNNLLTVINGSCELLEPELPQKASLRRHCEQIRKAGERAASLTRQLLAFSRQQVLEPRVLALNTVILDVEKMLNRVIGEDIELRTSLDPSLGSVKADRSQIEQVIMNLAVNARDAMPNGGRLTIQTANVIVDKAFARRHQPQQPGPYVRLSVRDTGIGMDAETQARIFEPFFTTKEVGKGTGLGLSTVYGAIRQSGGHIWVYSELGQGTSFEVYLPIVPERVLDEKPSGSADTPSNGTETILLVEDEEGVRELTRDLLAGSGYVVLEAESPEKALQTASHYPNPIHLLLTDVIMPGMNGPKLAQRLAMIRPEMKVVYMSGYTGFRQPQLPDSQAILLPKPFTREALLRKLRDALTLDVESKPK